MAHAGMRTLSGQDLWTFTAPGCSTTSLFLRNSTPWTSATHAFSAALPKRRRRPCAWPAPSGCAPPLRPTRSSPPSPLWRASAGPGWTQEISSSLRPMKIPATASPTRTITATAPRASAPAAHPA